MVRKDQVTSYVSVISSHQLNVQILPSNSVQLRGFQNCLQIYHTIFHPTLNLITQSTGISDLTESLQPGTCIDHMTYSDATFFPSNVNCVALQHNCYKKVQRKLRKCQQPLCLDFHFCSNAILWYNADKCFTNLGTGT
jgi:hypothetical protein